MHRLKIIRTAALLTASAGILLAPSVPAVAANASCGHEHIDIHHNFTSGNLDAWQMPYAEDWEILTEGNLHYLHMKHTRPPELPRHPIQFARLKNIKIGSFTLDVDVRRIGGSMAIEFNYQDPVHFYYTHLSDVPGTKISVHNGIFIVNGAARRRIAGMTAAPALPDLKWHHVRIVRNVRTGSIKVYMDHEKSPRFSVVNHSFTCGQVGL
ncbi:MAG: hypothetical protein ACRD28_03080, partial [Acidobacteriaceae bacterium]